MFAAAGWGFTFRDLDQVSDEVAVGLSRLGVGEGHVVALVLPSTPDYLVAYAAIAKLGAITTGVNPRLATPERNALVRDCAQADWVIGVGALLDGMTIDCPVVEIAAAESYAALFTGVRARDAVPPRLAEDPERVVTIVFTSGTTGLPKGAVFTNQLLRNNAIVDRGNGWGEGGPITGNTQYCHVGFMAKLPAQIQAGSTYHVVEPWRATTMLDTVSRFRMPAIGGVAPQIALMLREPDFDRYDFSVTNLIVCGGAPAAGALIREAKERFQAGWTQRYSLTETGACGCYTWIDASEEEMLYTVGRPRPGITVDIRDSDGNPLPDGETGDVWFDSPTNIRDYWRNPAATRQVMRGRWLNSGDRGFLDDEGRIRLMGRGGDAYSRGGYVIYPKEAEHVLSWHPQVAQIAIVPRPDEVMGAIGVAIVVPHDVSHPPTLDDLRTFGAEHIAKFKLPEALRIVESLPLTAMLKIDKRVLIAHESPPPDPGPPPPPPLPVL